MPIPAVSPQTLSLIRSRHALSIALFSACAFGCVSKPESTSTTPESRDLAELSSIVTQGNAQPIDGAVDVFRVGPEAELTEPESASDPQPTEGELERIEAALAARLTEQDADDPAAGLSDESPVAAPTEPPAVAPNPYLAFGERIVVHPDGRITKPYPLPPGKGSRMLDLMVLMSNQGMFSVEVVDAVNPGEPDPDVIQAVLLQNWDVELYQNLRTFPPLDSEIPMADWLVCTGSFELLEEVEYFIDLFGGNVPQIEIEAQIVELTETDILDWGVPDASAVFPDNALIDSLSFAFPNAETANEAILSLGAIQDGTTFDAIIQAVKTWENVSVISQPMIAVREGGKAEILNTEELPFFNVKSISDTGTFNATLDFKEVGVRLYIVPRIIGSDTLALNLDLEASQEAGSLTTVVGGSGSGAADLETPIIAKRSVKTVVYLKKGQALILGGLTTTRSRELERKVPFLGDIPLIGWLFKSRFTQVTKTHVLFFVKPRVLEGQDFQRDF